MTRWITLILFSLGVLHASGISLPSGMSDCATLCGSHERVAQPPVSSCCPLGDTQTQDDDYCPMSGGPCTCGLSPSDDTTPQEPMPAPQRDRDSLQMDRAPPISLRTIPLDIARIPLRSLRVGALHALVSHNQLQAILGIWIR